MSMMFIIVFWLLGALLAALAIFVDMRRLRVARVGLPVPAWMGVCLIAGPLAGVFYLYMRPAVRRRLIQTVWLYVGDDTHPIRMRRERLLTMRRSGLIGPAIHEACDRMLDREVERRSGESSQRL